MCDACLAEQGLDCEDAMNYKNFFVRGWEHTFIDHDMYLALENKPSDWCCLPGWRLETTMFDFMHCVFLGTGRDLVASAIHCLLVNGWFPNLDEVQKDIFAKCSAHGCLATYFAYDFMFTIF